VIAMPSPPEPMEPLVDVPDHTPTEASSDRPLTPGEALEKLFMDNAANGRNAANDELVEELQRRIRALRNTQIQGAAMARTVAPLAPRLIPRGRAQLSAWNYFPGERWSRLRESNP
jgi:hypothetical protein